MLRQKKRGFTLVELLVAVFVFAIIGALAFGGFNKLIDNRDQAERSAGRSRDIQASLFKLTQDFEELDSRPTREPLGTDYENALRVSAQTMNEIFLTRAGWSNPAGTQRPTLQRVRYRVEDGKLMRDYWAVLDPTPAVKPLSVQLLDHVKSLHLRYLDAAGTWHDDEWPPRTSGALPQLLCLRPTAVEIALDLEDWGKITRLIEVPG